MASQWYYQQAGNKLGPVSSDQLKALAVSGQLHATDLVWKDGLPEWILASRLPKLGFATESPESAAKQASTGPFVPVADPLSAFAGAASVPHSSTASTSHPPAAALPYSSALLGHLSRLKLQKPWMIGAGVAVLVVIGLLFAYTRMRSGQNPLEGDWVVDDDTGGTLTIAKGTVTLRESDGTGDSKPYTTDSSTNSITFSNANNDGSITATIRNDGRLVCTFQSGKTLVLSRRGSEGKGTGAGAGSGEGYTTTQSYKNGVQYSKNFVAERLAAINADNKQIIMDQLVSGLAGAKTDRDEIMRTTGPEASNTQYFCGRYDGYKAAMAAAGIAP